MLLTTADPEPASATMPPPRLFPIICQSSEQPQHSNGGALAAGPDVVSGYENTRRIPQLNGRARNSGIHVLNDVAADHDVVVRPPIIDRRSLAILDDVACD